MELKITHNKGVTIQDDLIGIFFEDINYGADGGLYAEMLENRSFEFLDARGDKDAYHQIFDGMQLAGLHPDIRYYPILLHKLLYPLIDVKPFLKHHQWTAAGFPEADGFFLRQLMIL